jgi:hypothetical protein
MLRGLRGGGWRVVYNQARFFQCSTVVSSCMSLHISEAGVSEVRCCSASRILKYGLKGYSWGYHSAVFVPGDELIAFHVRRRKL